MNDNSSQKFLNRGMARKTTLGLFAALSLMALSGVASAQDAKFFVSTGNTDGKLGALSRRPNADKKETETADDFDLKQTTVISGATIKGCARPSYALGKYCQRRSRGVSRFPAGLGRSLRERPE